MFELDSLRPAGGFCSSRLELPAGDQKRSQHAVRLLRGPEAGATLWDRHQDPSAQQAGEDAHHYHLPPNTYSYGQSFCLNSLFIRQTHLKCCWHSDLCLPAQVVCEMATAAMALSVLKRFRNFPCIIQNNPLFFSRKPDPRARTQTKVITASHDPSEVGCWYFI